MHGADIRLEPLALHPNDKLEPWFDAVASKVVTRESRFKWSRNLNNVRLHKAKVVRAITLLTIVLKVRGDMQGTATVFAYAPEIIAGDLRSNKLAEVFGTDTIRYLLEDIFLQIKTSSDAPAPQPLLSAARDLIVAYLARQDHHSLVHTDPEAVSRKLSHLFAFLDNTDGGEQPSFRLLAIKTGITYAAIVCTAYDMAQENEHNRGVFGADVQGVGMVVKAAVGMTPVGGSVASSAVEGAHNIIWDITDPKLKEHDTARNLVDDALDDFNSSIIYNANKGYILMRSTMTTPQVNAEDAKEYAITSTDYLKMLVQGVSLTAGQAKVWSASNKVR